VNYIIHNDYHILKICDTERGAKIALTRKWKRAYPNATVMSSVDFDAMEPRVQVKNHMTGQMITIPQSRVGTILDPSTEKYWCQ
jgi:hypothetical protein